MTILLWHFNGLNVELGWKIKITTQVLHSHAVYKTHQTQGESNETVDVAHFCNPDIIYLSQPGQKNTVCIYVCLLYLCRPCNTYSCVPLWRKLERRLLIQKVFPVVGARAALKMSIIFHLHPALHINHHCMYYNKLPESSYWPPSQGATAKRKRKIFLSNHWRHIGFGHLGSSWYVMFYFALIWSNKKRRRITGSSRWAARSLSRQRGKPFKPLGGEAQRPSKWLRQTGDLSNG